MTIAASLTKGTKVATAGAVFLLGCLAVGVFTVRSYSGLMLIGVLGCLAVYLINRKWMVGIALFLAFASLPPALGVSKNIGPVSIYPHEAAVYLAIAFLIPLARLRFSDFVLPGVFVITVAFAAVAGAERGYHPAVWANEALFLVDMVAGFIFALLVVRTNFVRGSMRVMTMVFWFSAAMLLASSLTGLALAGRTETLPIGPGSEQATRLLTSTQEPAIAALAALIAAQIVGRGKVSVQLAVGVPTLLITLLSFGRNTLIVVSVAAVVAVVASLGWHALRRTAVMVAVVAALLGVIVPVTLFLLQHSSVGTWFADQIDGFSERVFGSLSENALAVDQSTQDRLRENGYLESAFAQSPLFGHGLGYVYRLPFGKAGTFTATLGTTYAHNFYLWWLAKAGVAGMASFAAFALTPVVRGILSASPEAKISAAVSAGLLTVCVVDPLPLEPSSALLLGMALGATMGFAKSPPRAEQLEPSLEPNGALAKV